ncbi:hypothetical protein PIB30_049249 [Stylosanthes scabra]|uniref:Uncharacterized protein n=1 Tax=Stylosanthes scabra TaxID=79078 RepID=A0ABU6THN3_9FABA|nr:hypothetical protein [Stylosanthes scabra]
MNVPEQTPSSLQRMFYHNSPSRSCVIPSLSPSTTALRRTALVPFFPTVTSVLLAPAPRLPRSNLSLILKLTTDWVLVSSLGAALRQVLRCHQELIRNVWSATSLILPSVSSSSSVLWCHHSPDLKPAAQGHKIGVKEAYCRREVMATTIFENNCHEAGTYPRNIGVRIVKKVKERENDLANELVIMMREEDRGSKSRVLVSHDILDEWCFSSYKENLSIGAIEKKLQEVLSDASSDYQFIIVRENEAFVDRGDFLQLQDMEKLSYIEFSMKKGKMSEHVQYDREIFPTSNSVRPSDLEETINQIWKVHCQGGKIKKKKWITRKAICDKKQKEKTKKGGRQKVTKEVEKLGIEVVNDNNDALEKLQAKDDAPKGDQVKEIEKMKSRDAYVSNVDFETRGYEDGENLMIILKEQNEAIALKRRKAKQKEKARKSRPKRAK